MSFVETGILIFMKLNRRLNLIFVKLFLGIVSVLFLIQPYQDILSILKYPEKDIYSLDFDGAYLRYLRSGMPDIKNLTVFKIEHNEALYDQVLFYIRAYEEKDQYHVRLTQEMNFQKDEIVMVCKQEDQIKLFENYSVKVLNSWKAGNLVQILNRN
jgi:hypothetical protein